MPIMSLGYRSSEVTTNLGHPTYPNLLDQLVSQNIIASPTYSIYLNGFDYSSGSILFGGVDLNKFTPPLYTLPINSDLSGSFVRFWVSLTGLGVTVPGSTSSVSIGTSTFPLSVLFDTGTTFSYLPTAVVAPLAEALHATSGPDAQGRYTVPCSLQSQSGHIDFVFSGLQLHIPYSQLIFEVSTGECVLGIMADDSGCSNVLGDSFLRNIYVVYDLVQMAIGNILIEGQ